MFIQIVALHLLFSSSAKWVIMSNTTHHVGKMLEQTLLKIVRQIKKKKTARPNASKRDRERDRNEPETASRHTVLQFPKATPRS